MELMMVISFIMLVMLMTDFADIKVTQRVNSEDRIVTVNEKVLSKSEIIDLLVEYMEENVGLHQETGAGYRLLEDMISDRSSSPLLSTAREAR